MFRLPRPNAIRCTSLRHVRGGRVPTTMDEIRAQDPSFEVKGSLSREQVDRIVRALPKGARIQALENTEKYMNEHYTKSGWSDREKRHIARETIARAVVAERRQPWLKEFLLTNDDRLLGKETDYIERTIKTMALQTCIEDAHHSLIRDGLSTNKPVSSVGRQPFEPGMKYFDRLTIDPIVDGLLNRQFHADPSNVEIRFWSAKIPLLGEYYINKLFLAAVFWVLLSWLCMQLMPEGVSENELYKTLRTPLTRVFDPKDRGALPIGNGSYANPVLIGNLPVDPEMPGLRKIERDSLPVIDDSWFHQFQAKMLVEFYKLQRAVGIGSNSEIEEEKLVQVDRDIPDWVGNRYLYFNRGLNRGQAEKALLSGLHDVNQRRLFNWQEIADSPVATQCDLNTLKDMQAHAAKLDTIPFRQSFVQSSFYQAWRDKKKEIESQGIPFEEYVVDKQYEDFLRGPKPDVARAELTKVLCLSLYTFLAARMTYARLKIVSYIKHPAERRANKFRYFGRADRVFVDSATTRFINSTFATQQGAGFSAVMFKTSIIATIKVLQPKQGLLLMKLLNMGLLGSSLYFWIWYLSTNRSSCLNDNADGWFATYFSWWRSVTGTHDPVKQLANLTERVLIKDLYIKDGNVYFYENGGPLLNCNSTKFNHMASHKRWFLSVNDKHWLPSGAYEERE